MYPPKPTKDPYELLNNLYFSLCRAGEHWSGDSTIDAGPDGYHVTLRFSTAHSDSSWEAASKYIKRYARASHWKVHGLTRRKTHAELLISHSPPDPKKKQRRAQYLASRKTS